MKEVLIVVAGVVGDAAWITALVFWRRRKRKGRYPTPTDIQRQYARRGGITGCPGCGLVGEHADDCSFRPIR